MRKLKLDIHALKVESFAPLQTRTETGTVHGQLASGEDPDFTIMLCGTAGTCVGPTYCCPVTWKASCNSCAETWCSPTECMGTCEESCMNPPACTIDGPGCSI